MALINAINNATSELTVDPGTSGDSFVQFDLNSTSEFRIGVDDTDDSFRISQGSSLGTNDALMITSDGNITKPLNPAFLVSSAGQTNITGDATFLFLTFTGTEYFDQNNDFASSTFTAQITGQYFLFTTISLNGLAGTHSWGQLRITTSNLNFLTFYSPKNLANNSGELTLNIKGVFNMDVGDTANVGLYVKGGPKTVGVISGADSVFGGYLID